MNAWSPFLCVERPFLETQDWLKKRLARQSLRALQTFDLHDARLGSAHCPCPNHGTSHCDCEMVILLVYGSSAQPATLILHGNDGQSWVSLVHTPLQPVDPAIRAAIEHALQSSPPA